MLSRRWLINCALFAIVAILALVIANVDDAEIENDGQRISQLRPADIERIEITTAELSLELRRDANGWQMLQPLQWPAHADNVERLLSILKQQSTAIASAAEADLPALGLQPPVATLRLNDRLLQFGATNNIGERRYLLMEAAVYLLPDVHLAFATQGIAGMVDRRLLPQRGEIANLRLPGIEISRDADGSFRAAGRPGLTSDQLGQLVTNWQALPANGIRPFNADARPGELISVRFASGEEIDFLLQSSAPEIIVANPLIGLQYHFRGDYRDQLIAPAGGD